MISKENENSIPEFVIKPASSHIDGYASYLRTPPYVSPDTTTEEYAGVQLDVNEKKTLDYLLPIIRQCKANRLLDVGCGIGTMVRTLLDNEFESYGADLAGLSRFWQRQKHPADRFFIVDPTVLELPFYEGTVDFAFTFGAIEHVGTADGQADRLSQYHQIRKQWLREIFRTIRPGGFMLIGGPNRNFPIDVAHGLDSHASGIEKVLSRMVGASVHKIWGENFLWGYSDFTEYLNGLPYTMRALSINHFLGFSRVPRLIRPLVEGYVRHLPESLLATGFNPWVMALIQKNEVDHTSHQGYSE